MQPKAEANALKKQLNKKLSAALAHAKQTDDEDAVSRIITFGSMPSYREDKMQEMKARHKNGESSSEGEFASSTRHLGTRV